MNPDISQRIRALQSQAELLAQDYMRYLSNDRPDLAVMVTKSLAKVAESIESLGDIIVADDSPKF